MAWHIHACTQHAAFHVSLDVHVLMLSLSNQFEFIVLGHFHLEARAMLDGS